ncbi:5-bromo-4-chloroindolyl phosphate hydrolysis family protein [uncultured Aliiroseovarius sp.]|uniref:5-bromo-4-chloroindolyl phosphate hydrolysis family protein n=1 Tax=uncultured Aliiroseovarius sp. TaxID=1658783 RepID=UPI0026025F7C|nr:5-bromo-4-chloroindolyl phosphate hydrolysis family protein [uncultured Aliiroseovarius sp.]
MSQRFGGEFSPNGQPKTQGKAPVRRPFDGKQPARSAGRVNFLFIAPLPLAIRAFFQDPAGLAMTLAAFGLLILSAWMTRDGVFAHQAYDARKIARRPAIPRKIFGSVLMGAGLGLAGFVGGSMASAIIFAVLGAGLHFAAFGPDPLRNKGVDGVDTFQTDRVARAVTEAEKHLSAMKESIGRTRDRHLQARIDSFSTTAREMFRTVEDDPRDLTAARKYLGVYLLGARDATTKFVDIYQREPKGGARAAYETLLDDLEANFTARTQQFLSDNRTDLDVEIEVLRERLAREGVRME